jgi:hypothetical protein
MDSSFNAGSMISKYFIFGICYFILFNSNLQILADISETKTTSESTTLLALGDNSQDNANSVEDLLKQNVLTSKIIAVLKENQSDSDKIQLALENVYTLLNKHYTQEKNSNIIINKKESEKFNVLNKLKNRNLLLKVIIPIVVTVVIFYTLYYYYQSTSLWPDIGLWTFYSDIARILKSSLYRTINAIIAIAQLSSIGEKTNSIIVDALRVINELLLLKNQFSPDAFEQGAYYTAGWFIFDTYNLIKTIFKDFISKEKSDKKPTPEKNDDQLEKVGKTLSSHILPIAQSAAALYLAINVDTNPYANNSIKAMQAVYSLTRILPWYLQAKNDLVDALLTAHILILFLDFSSGIGLYSNGNFGKKIQANTSIQNNNESNKPKNNSDNQATKENPCNQIAAHTKKESVLAANTYLIKETPLPIHAIDDSLLTYLKQKLDEITNKNPENSNPLKDISLETSGNFVNKKIDFRNIRIILEKKLKQILVNEMKYTCT